MEIKWRWGEDSDGYFMQLGQFVAQDKDPQRGWLKLYRQVEAAVAKGEVADMYLHCEEMVLLRGTFTMIMKVIEEQRREREREASLVRNEKARSDMLDYATQEGYRA